MALSNNFLFVWTFIVLLLVSISSPSLSVYSQVQGCSLVGIEIQNCLVPSSQQTPYSIGSCCATLNLVLEAGYHCLCTLIGSSGYPVFSAELQLSFSNCYISVPPLTHCHVLEPKPIVSAPPAAAIPLLNEPPPSPAPPLPPSPDLERGEGFVPLPPKVNETPLNEDFNSSIVDGNPVLNSTPLPIIGIPESWEYVKSNGANVRTLVNSRNVLVFVGSWVYYMKNVNWF